VLAETQTITRAALWDCYKKWTEQNEGYPLPQKVFTQKLEGKGLMRERTQQDPNLGRYWITTN